MWIVFDQLWGLPTSLALKREVISTFRLQARLVPEPLTTETRAAVYRIRALRATINASFDGMRALADGVLFAFGTAREQARQTSLTVWKTRRRRPTRSITRSRSSNMSVDTTTHSFSRSRDGSRALRPRSTRKSGARCTIH